MNDSTLILHKGTGYKQNRRDLENVPWNGWWRGQSSILQRVQGLFHQNPGACNGHSEGQKVVP